MKNKKLLLKCMCGCKSQLQIYYYQGDTMSIDIRDDGRSRWHGVVLLEDLPKIIKFFKEID